jgi:hypothetical protein
MNDQPLVMCPARSAILGFLGVMVTAVAIVIAHQTGFIDDLTTKRALGLVLGAMIVLVGNVTPKLRPLRARGLSQRATAMERFGGWVLVLAGISYIVLFLAAPLALARRAAAGAGVAALLLIAGAWAWTAFRLRRDGTAEVESALEPRTKPSESQTIAIHLLFACVFVIAIACVTFLFEGVSGLRDQMSWALIAFGVLYATLLPLMAPGRDSRER